MRTCKGTWFKLRCQLLATEPIIPWIEVTSLQVVNKILYSLPAVHYFPDTTPTATESKEFTATVGENLLDTDLGVDEIYAKLILSNLNTTVSITKNTNVVRHSF